MRNLWFPALLKYLASFFKHDWELNDYPIWLKHQDVNVQGIETLKLAPWHATIIHWTQIYGSGETKEKALADLKQRFDEYKQQHGGVPRPGLPDPMLFFLAGKVQKHTPIARDFFDRILDMDFDTCFISDRSSLWDLAYEDEAVMLSKVEKIYGIDISDIRSGNLVQIFSRLEEHIQGQS